MNELVETVERFQKATGLNENTWWALESLKKTDFPTKKWEAWKYTPAKHFVREEISFAHNITKEIDRPLFASFNNRAVFCNGHLQENSSKLEATIEISTISSKDFLKDLLVETESLDYFENFNYAISEQTIQFLVKKNTVIEDPLVIFHQNDVDSKDTLSRSNIKVHAEQGASLTVIEVFEGESSCHNSLTSIEVDQNARVTHIKLVATKSEHNHLGTLRAKVERDGHLDSFTFTLGGAFTRNNLFVDLAGENAHANVHGLYTLKDTQHSDNFSLIRHLVPHTTSHQLFKGILNDEARGVFNGKILIEKYAVGSSSEQLNKNLLLTKKAHVNTRPQLEVYNDDVKCAHGSTVGQISEEEVFYLESRGINKSRARKILCHAFANDVIEKISNNEIRNVVSALLFSNFEQDVLEKLDS